MFIDMWYICASALLYHCMYYVWSIAN